MKGIYCLLFCLLIPLLPLSSAQAVETIVTDQYTIYHYTENVSRLDITTRWRPYTITVVHGDEGILLIDTGISFEAEVVDKAIAHISDQPIKKIILTHSHPDHAGGVARLGKNADLYANKEGEFEGFFNLEPVATYPYPVNFYPGFAFVCIQQRND